MKFEPMNPEPPVTRIVFSILAKRVRLGLRPTGGALRF